MKNSIRLKILFVLAFVFTLMASVGIISAIDVKAAPQTFAMHPGASVRLGNENDTQTGIRFIATIDSEEYNQLLSDYENVQFGMRIARCETVEELMLFPDESSMKPVDTVVENAEEGIHVISVAIHNIKAENYNTYFTALGYVEVTDAQGEKEVFYADYVAGENSRTPFQVVATHKLQYGMFEELNMDYANAILDNVLAQGGMIAQKAEYVLALNSSVAPVIEVAGVPVDADLSVANTAVAKIENGQLVAVGAGSTTLTAVVSGAEKILNISIPVTVENSTLALTYANGTVEWAGVATAVVIDGNEVAVSETENAFDVAAYLKKNGYEEKSYTVAVKNGEVVSESVTIEMKNVDNADELLAISEGSANTYYVVTDNISLAGKEVSTFGTSRAFIESLTGVLDVNGYAIYAINYNETENVDSNYCGLIALVDTTGVVKNGYFTGAISIKGNNNEFLIGNLKGTLDNCYVKVSQFDVDYTTSASAGSKNYRTAQAILMGASDAIISNCIFEEPGNKGKPIVHHSSGYAFENVIALTHETSTITLYSAGAYGGNYVGYDKNNVYVYENQSSMFEGSGTIKKYDGTNHIYASTVKVPYLNFAPVFDFDEQAGKIYMVNDKYGKMDFAVSINIAQDELDVVKDKYSPQISVTLSGIYGSDALTYKSSNTAVATVDENGVVTYVGNGTATITVTHTESGATATVNVKTFDTYIGITDLATFVTIEGATQYTYAELLSDISITDDDLSYYKVSSGITPYSLTKTYVYTLIDGSFEGTLNGNGKKINATLDLKSVTHATVTTSGETTKTTYDYYLDDSNCKTFALLFQNIGTNGVVKNLIVNANVSTYKTSACALSYHNSGLIKDCVFDGYIWGRSGHGSTYIVNYSQGAVENIISNMFTYNGGTGNGKYTMRFMCSDRRGWSTMKNILIITFRNDAATHVYAGLDPRSTQASFNYYKYGTNVSTYSSLANALAGTGYQVTYVDGDTANTYTEITNNPQYNLFGSAWSFGADGIKLCGTAIYTPAN